MYSTMNIITSTNLTTTPALIHEASGAHGDGQIHVVHFQFEYVRDPLIVSIFILSIAVFKVLLHHAKKLSEIIPESCILILLGCAYGGFFLVGKTDEFRRLVTFSTRTFFLFLLPPIILESSYSLKDRAFIENLGTIILYAVVGTFINIMLIGGSIYGLYEVGAISRSLKLRTLDCFVFSSLIAAVDPVAVLAIFEEVGVNKMLFFMVFGESLLNDAVTVVFYNLMVTLVSVPHIGAVEILMGIASFVCVAGGGALIGFFCGLVTALITKYTSKVRVVEPITMYVMAYLSYLLAEMIHFSGIISIICCGILQATYASSNISPKSYITVSFFAKVMSSCTEAIIFIILGVMLVIEKHEWNAGFVLWSLLLCLIFRFIVVVVLTWIVNAAEEGLRKISKHEQFIMSYGGLRGAVSFSLAFMLDPVVFPEKRVLLTATLTIIMFTVFVQGITIKPLVRLLRISTQAKGTTLWVELNRGMVGNLAAGIEEITGHHGSHFMHDYMRHFSQKVIRPLIQKYPTRPGTGLLSAYTEAALRTNIQQVQPMSRKQSSVTINAVIDSLQTLEQSQAPSSLGQVMIDVEEESMREMEKKRPGRFKKSKKKKKKETPEKHQELNPDSTKSMLQFRDLLNSPLSNTLTFKNVDRNMSSVKSSENLKRLALLVQHRQNRARLGIQGMLDTAMQPTAGQRSSLAFDRIGDVELGKPDFKRSVSEGPGHDGHPIRLSGEMEEKRPLFTLSDRKPATETEL